MIIEIDQTCGPIEKIRFHIATIERWELGDKIVINM